MIYVGKGSRGWELVVCWVDVSVHPLFYEGSATTPSFLSWHLRSSASSFCCICLVHHIHKISMTMTVAVRGTVIAQYRQLPGVASLYSGVLSRV
jgi:predicted signal transduction protein with EAL and GGDEF domain